MKLHETSDDNGTRWLHITASKAPDRDQAIADAEKIAVAHFGGPVEYQGGTFAGGTAMTSWVKQY